MKQFFLILSLVLLAVGALTFYLIPVLWQPEPVLAFRVGIGAGIFSILFVVAVLIQIVLVSRDWGAERSARKVTRERDDSHRQFLRRLDHELKNPLTGLQVTLTNLREAESDQEIQQGVENATQAANRLGRILGDLRGDAAHADSARQAAAIIRRKTAKQAVKVFFSGHWGFQYYMELWGAKPLDLSDRRYASGDVIVEAVNNTNRNTVPENLARSEEWIRMDQKRWVTTMHGSRGAGFYSSRWGPLPFALGPAPPEEYRLIQLR